MSDAVTINEDGVLTVDMAQADALWRALDPMKQAELTNMMFEPVLAKATELSAENAELRARLKACLDWMETGRASGDWGYWDWEEGDVYTLGRAALAELTGGKDD